MSNSFPSFKRICEFVDENPEIAWSEVVGVSGEGRDVLATHVAIRICL